MVLFVVSCPRVRHLRKGQCAGRHPLEDSTKDPPGGYCGSTIGRTDLMVAEDIAALLGLI